MPSSKNNEVELPLFVGVDVGGTNIKIGVVDDAGVTVAETKFPTEPDKSPRIAFETAKRELDQLLSNYQYQWSDVAAVGLGTPGPMNIKSGSILTPSNLPGWHQFPVRDELSKILDMPVSYANDAGAAAFGEFWIGSGQQFDSMVLFTLGTGVGGGIIIDGVSLDGVHSHGAEVGHITVETGDDARTCGCGQTGHLESYASATGLVARTREAMSGNNGEATDTILRRQIADDSPLSALMISKAAAAGDRLANQLIGETAEYLGRGVALLAHIVDPEAFILGGAMNFGGSGAPLGQKFLDDVSSAARKLMFPVLAENLIVRFAKLGSEAGYIGAAGLARQGHYKKAIVN